MQQGARPGAGEEAPAGGPLYLSAGAEGGLWGELGPFCFTVFINGCFLRQDGGPVLGASLG